MITDTDIRSNTTFFPARSKYSDIPNQYIIDKTFTGGRKTENARYFAIDEVINGRCTIIVMQDYPILDISYYQQFPEYIQNRTITFRGRTQKGICKNWENLGSLYKHIIPQKGCDPLCSEDCEYIRQHKKLTELKKDGGFIILTVAKMLPYVLKLINSRSRQTTIIIDDIPFADVVSNKGYTKRSDLFEIIQITENNQPVSNHIAQMVLEEQDESEILSYLVQDNQLNFKILESELDELQEEIKHYQCGKYPDFKILSSYYIAIKYGLEISTYYEKCVDRSTMVYETIHDDITNYRIIYLNATTSLRDDFYLEKLENPHIIESEAEPHENYLIMQICDSRYPKTTLMKSSLVANTIETIFKSIDRAVKFVDVKIPLFMHETVYETWNNNGKIDFKETNHDFVNYFGSRTKSTNEFIDCPISLIVGTPYLPPLAFMERAYRSHWKSNEEIETESESKKNRSTYPVPRSVSDRCAKGEVVQMTSRTLRGSDSPKVIVLLTDLDIQDDCQKQNGATIKKYKIRNKTDKAIFFDDFIKFIRNALRPHIIRKILNGGYEGKKIVDVCREFSHETDDLFSESQIRRIIEDNFKIETRFIEKSGKKIKTAYIESITEEGQSLAYPIK